MGPVDKNEIGHRQQEMLKCIWHLGGEATLPQVSKELEAAYNVKLTSQALNCMIILLIGKGVVEKTERKQGKAFFYKALIDEKSFRKRELKRIINLTFDGDYQAVGEALIAQSLPMEDLEALQERLAAEVEKRKARKAKRSKKKEASEE